MEGTQPRLAQGISGMTGEFSKDVQGEFYGKNREYFPLFVLDLMHILQISRSGGSIQTQLLDRLLGLHCGGGQGQGEQDQMKLAVSSYSVRYMSTISKGRGT